MIALLIVIGFIAVVFAVPGPEPQKTPEPKPEAKPVVINVYRTSHVHKHVVVRVQMLVVDGTQPIAQVRALDRYRAPLAPPPSKTKIEA